MPEEREKELVLVLGGARSGKSDWAQRYAEAGFPLRIFLATARVFDAEMADRVKRHKAARGPDWGLIEESLEIPGVLRRECRQGRVVLLDCLTVWLGNVLVEKGEDAVRPYMGSLLDGLRERSGPIILVSNEVGMGIVPETPLGRTFRDHAGRLNQRIAAAADRVVFMIAGLPMALKGKMPADAGANAPYREEGNL